MSDQSEREGQLALAGLSVQPAVAVPAGAVPPAVAGQMMSVLPGDTRSEAWVDVEDPLLHEKANSDWYRLSVTNGLFKEEDPTFFIALRPPGEEGPSRWTCVTLQDPWDIMGKGAAGILGSSYGRPEFLTLSRDGSVLCCGTTSQFSIGTVVVTSPERQEVLRRFARYLSIADIGHPESRAAAKRWLDSTE
ncbi:hypothetical protein [Streptomyces bambusae]|uniref:Uncharacterized protein n=1 Tax=Streptomyces bambusae TaxID=1550616 RepID=A0ABS6Z2U9_9ACTN|nr:hypothetical protein [Streptomyces bambusae]MBW5482083.1 hypothetical protein [Streptomyces bambusae]